MIILQKFVKNKLHKTELQLRVNWILKDTLRTKFAIHYIKQNDKGVSLSRSAHLILQKRFHFQFFIRENAFCFICL